MTPPIPSTPPADFLLKRNTDALQRDTAVQLWQQILNTYTGDSPHDVAMRDAANAALAELEQ